MIWDKLWYTRKTQASTGWDEARWDRTGYDTTQSVWLYRYVKWKRAAGADDTCKQWQSTLLWYLANLSDFTELWNDESYVHYTAQCEFV